ncbi:transmembrane protein, putative [Medicago truncatula]|nr:transmembrane protein, putative [Medicago truncatula]
MGSACGGDGSGQSLVWWMDDAVKADMLAGEWYHKVRERSCSKDSESIVGRRNRDDGVNSFFLLCCLPCCCCFNTFAFAGFESKF